MGEIFSNNKYKFQVGIITHLILPTILHRRNTRWTSEPLDPNNFWFDHSNYRVPTKTVSLFHSCCIWKILFIILKLSEFLPFTQNAQSISTNAFLYQHVICLLSQQMFCQNNKQLTMNHNCWYEIHLLTDRNS